MPIAQLLITIYCTVLAFSAIHAPQPLLPTLQAAFSVSEPKASLLLTATLLPLAIAPIAYGFVLQRVSSRQMLVVASGLLAVTQLAVAMAPSFEILLGLRLVQGLLIPAILTALMTYLAASAAPGRTTRVMAGYVAATVLGGFLGRAIAGAVTTAASWEAAFLLFGLAQLLCTALLLRLDADPQAGFGRLDRRAVGQILRQPRALRVYGAIFCAFFVFLSLLTFLPFRLVELETGLSDLGIALMYTGYLMGVVTALSALRVADRIGGVVNTMLLGIAIFAASLAMFLGPWLVVIFAGMFVFCAGMFLLHALAPGYLNQEVEGETGVVNGLYIAFYYAGGAVGSWLPGYLYHGLSWEAYVASLAAMLGLAGYWIWGLRDRGAGPARTG
ncbi:MULTISPECIES: MFS transporter [unclassified Halorhodospira]|uniref:MFS transporter n=1 Tax=unclassified Halorhodospira TaxID=2626748 RepID=UPI001EE80097|nr:MULTISPECIES: MFS transporter [unclassified Halorhodospira]MCG5540604.1 MFS transporter [Halorhodospira sp. M39old]MCG5546197.1 MFS transporter [Halorhodospira sp. M38]